MTSAGVQQLFFQHIRDNLPAHLSFVDEVADVLSISNDSAYRRIRGEKSINFEELQTLCLNYKISLDSFLQLKSNSFIFNGKLKTDSENSFEEWLKDILFQLRLFNSFEKRHVYFLMKDIPPFVHFLFPELARFKYFFWMKSILHYESLKGVKFAFDDPRYDQFDVIAKDIVDAYLKVPMTEIWNIESIESTLRQIAFYRDAGSFKSQADVKLLYTKVEEMINHIEREAEYGMKFNLGEEPAGHMPEYRMYVNELILGDNTVFAELNDKRITFLNYGVLFIVYTKDERFNRGMAENLDNLIKKSMMISKSGEKERARFFNRLREKIYQYKGY